MESSSKRSFSLSSLSSHPPPTSTRYSHLHAYMRCEMLIATVNSLASHFLYCFYWWILFWFPNIFCVIEAVEIQMIRCVMPNGFGLCNWNNSRTTPSTTNGWKSSYTKTKAKEGRFIRMIFAIVDLFLCLLDEYCAYSAWQCCSRLCCTKSLAKLQCSSILRGEKLSAISSEHIIQYCLYSSVVCCACMW